MHLQNLLFVQHFKFLTIIFLSCVKVAPLQPKTEPDSEPDSSEEEEEEESESDGKSKQQQQQQQQPGVASVQQAQVLSVKTPNGQVIQIPNASTVGNVSQPAAVAAAAGGSTIHIPGIGNVQVRECWRITFFV